jgi:hypothetical protein
VTTTIASIDKFIQDQLDLCHSFKGDKRLFWAGRMSLLIELINRSNIVNVSNLFERLNCVSIEYDKLIMSKYKFNGK